MPKSFLRFIKEEEQQQGVDPIAAFWFLAQNRWGASSSNFTGSLGASSSWANGGNLTNLPQFVLDLYDYNGDGLVGSNDQALIREIADLAYQIYAQTGEYPPIMTAEDYLENWEYYSELYGVDFPDPNGYAGQPGGGQSPDQPGNGDASTVGGWRYSYAFWKGQLDALGMENFILMFGQDVYDEIMALYDLDGDGVLRTNIGQSGTDNYGEAAIWLMILYYMSTRGFDVNDTPMPEDVNNFLYNATRLTDTPLADLVNDFYGVQGLPFRPTPPEQPPESPGGDFGGSAPIRP